MSWIGWRLDFANMTIQFIQLQSVWFTFIAKHLRPHLHACMLLRQLLGEFCQLPIDSKAMIVRQHPHFVLPIGGKLVEPTYHGPAKHQCVRVSLQCTELPPLEVPSPFQRQVPIFPFVRAAADAFAEGDSFGIEGWISTSSQVVWFSEQLTMAQLRQFTPSLKKEAQEYISAFEILAQLALLLIAGLQKIATLHPFFNAGAEASVNKMLTMKEPTTTFLQIMAFQHRIQLTMSHIPGHVNDWADNLSRDKLGHWKSYPRCSDLIRLFNRRQANRFASGIIPHAMAIQAHARSAKSASDSASLFVFSCLSDFDLNRSRFNLR